MTTTQPVERGANMVNGTSFPKLIDATIDDLKDGLSKGLFTSVDLVKAYLARIEEVNEAVHAVTETNPDALDIAASLDEERSKGNARGPLHGVPILIKNNIATNDKMNNTAGSWLLVGATVPRDATVVAKLRDAGAIILGKANLAQWANFRSRDSTSGWSSHGGQVVAAYCADQDADSSSSGSGVAADLGLAFATLGTETEGSIILPAHRNGVVGIKPTVGLTSRYLVIPISEYQDTVGPMAKTVRDAAVVLQAMVGADPRDKYTLAAPSQIPNYLDACIPGRLQGKRIGVPWNVINLRLERKNDIERTELQIEIGAFKEALATMARNGATIVDADFPKAKELMDTDTRRPIMGADFMTSIEAYLSELTHNPSGARTLSDLRDLTRKHPKEGYPERSTGIWDEAIERGFGNTDPRAVALRQETLELAGPGCLLGALDRHDLTAVALPTGIAARWTASIGAPCITVPLGHYPDTISQRIENGLVQGGPRMPFGLAFLGGLWSEVELISLGYGFEQLTNVRGRLVKRVVEPTTEV